MSPRPPVAGFNHNVRYRNRAYHVQTEDSGVANPHIFTHLFHGGLIITSARTDYRDIANVPGSEAQVRKLMQGQHKLVMKQLIGGQLDERIGALLGSVEPDEAAAAQAPEASAEGAAVSPGLGDGAGVAGGVETPVAEVLAAMEAELGTDDYPAAAAQLAAAQATPQPPAASAPQPPAQATPQPPAAAAQPRPAPTQPVPSPGRSPSITGAPASPARPGSSPQQTREQPQPRDTSGGVAPAGRRAPTLRPDAMAGSGPISPLSQAAGAGARSPTGSAAMAARAAGAAPSGTSERPVLTAPEATRAPAPVATPVTARPPGMAPSTATGGAAAWPATGGKAAAAASDRTTSERFGVYALHAPKTSGTGERPAAAGRAPAAPGVPVAPPAGAVPTRRPSSPGERAAQPAAPRVVVKPPQGSTIQRYTAPSRASTRAPAKRFGPPRPAASPPGRGPDARAAPPRAVRPSQPVGPMRGAGAAGRSATGAPPAVPGGQAPPQAVPTEHLHSLAQRKERQTLSRVPFAEGARGASVPGRDGRPGGTGEQPAVIVSRPVIIDQPPEAVPSPIPAGPLRGRVPLAGAPANLTGPEYPAARPASASVRPTTLPPVAESPPSIFGSDLISERSLDEVILAYLAEDSGLSEE